MEAATQAARAVQVRPAWSSSHAVSERIHASACLSAHPDGGQDAPSLLDLANPTTRFLRQVEAVMLAMK